MPAHRLTQSEYALQQVVEHFGNFLFSLEKHYLTHTYRVVFRFCELKNVNCLVLRYLNTGTVPFEEFSEEWLFDGEVEFLFTEAIVRGFPLTEYTYLR